MPVFCSQASTITYLHSKTTRNAEAVLSGSKLAEKYDKSCKCQASISYTYTDSQGWTSKLTYSVTADTCEQAGAIIDIMVSMANYYCGGCIDVE